MRCLMYLSTFFSMNKLQPIIRKKRKRMKKRKMSKKKKKMKRKKKKKEGGEEALIIGAQKKAKKPVKINILAKMTQKPKARKCLSLGAWSADASGFQNTS